MEHIDTRFINCSWLFYISRKFLASRWDVGPIECFLWVCTDLLKCEQFLTALCGRNQYFSGCCISFFFNVTVIMLRLTCKLSMVQKTHSPSRYPLTCTVKLWLLPDVASHFVRSYVFFFSIVHRHIVCLRCCWNYRECSQPVINNDS